MLAISRFRSGGQAFVAEAEQVVAFWRSCRGCVDARLVQNLDEPELWAIISEWGTVGDYRRSFQGYEAKMLLTPLLSRAIDEPSAYLPPEELGSNVPRGQ